MNIQKYGKSQYDDEFMRKLSRKKETGSSNITSDINYPPQAEQTPVFTYFCFSKPSWSFMAFFFEEDYKLLTKRIV